ncbi:MAG: response regulator transcription factor [Bacteroidetes bacterium]|nr:MAG: response regulator transcription factor [Bacteroidota bacterium]
MKAKILLAEDDMNLGFVIADQLKSESFDVVLAVDGAEAFQKFHQEKFHLCIFDVMMPKKDGFTLAKEIRKQDAEIPILFLTAKSMTEDKIEGFKHGGDDYLTKPFNFEELLLRIKSLLKRVQVYTEDVQETVIDLGEYRYDTENYQLEHPAFTKSLTKKEAQILTVLCKHKNQVVSRETLMVAVWGKEDYFIGRSLDVFITKLRKYLSEDPRVQIANVHGIGFKLELGDNE